MKPVEESNASQDAQNPEAWLEAAATKTLDLAQMDALVAKSAELWAIYDEKKKVSTDAFNEAEKVDAAIITALRDAGKLSYKVDGVGTCSIVQKSSVRVPSTIEAKKAFFAYLRSISEEVLFSLATVNSATLNAWYNERFEEAASRAKADGGPLDFTVPGVDGPTTRESLRFLKDKKKGA